MTFKNSIFAHNLQKPHIPQENNEFVEIKLIKF